MQRIITIIFSLTCSALIQAQTPAGAGQTPEEVAARDNADALRGMGYAMGSQLGLNFGWNPEEISYILDGMRRAAEGGDPYEDMQARLQRAQLIFRQKQMTFQAEQERQQRMQSDINEAEAQEFLAELQVNEEGLQMSDSGLYYKIIEEGGSTRADPQDQVKVNYTGTLIDGTVFDTTDTRGQPATFPVSGVVAGFGEGVQLVGEGGKVKLWIPSELGYGQNPRPGGAIKPGDLLIFDVEILEIIEAEVEGQRTPPGMTPPPGPPPDFTPPPPPTGMTPPAPPDRNR